MQPIRSNAESCNTFVPTSGLTLPLPYRPHNYEVLLHLAVCRTAWTELTAGNEWGSMKQTVAE